MAAHVTLPEGYMRVEGPEGWGFATAAATSWLQENLNRGVDLHGWAAGQPSAREMIGRGSVLSVEAPVAGPDGRARWVVRHYYRGGSVASLLVDRYLDAGTPRPLAELRASVQARSRGVPTPAVVAGAVYPAGLFYRADLVTEQIPEGRDLAEILFGGASDDADRMQAMEASGALIRSLERSGVHHRDVNAKNIVLSGSGGELSGYLVDLDRCRIRPDGVSAPTVPMRQRLERSLRKLERSTGRGLDGRAWDALDLGFGTVS